jgi:hypothetical protein
MPTFHSEKEFFVGAAAVNEHLKQMKDFYDSLTNFDGNKLKLYEYFLDLEHNYVTNGFPASNYCDIVLKLHPVKYIDYFERCNSASKDQNIDDRMDYNNVYSIRQTLVCPQCEVPIPIEDSFKLHITKELKAYNCRECKGQITYENLLVTAFLKNSNNLLTQLVTSSPPKLMDFKSLSLWFKDSLNSYIRLNKSSLYKAFKKHEFQAHFSKIRAKFADKVKYVRNNLSFLPMDLVQGLFIQLEFVNKICSNFEHWSTNRSVEAAIERYWKFFNLLATHPGKMLVPTVDIDLAWHAHQVAPNALYRNYCQKIAGKVVDHDDTLGKSPLATGYARTFVLWNKVYKEYYSQKCPNFKDYFYRTSHYFNPLRWYNWNKYGKIMNNRPIARSNSSNVVATQSSCAAGCAPIFIYNDEGGEGKDCDSACATTCANGDTGGCAGGCGSSCGGTACGGFGSACGSSCGGGHSGDGGGDSGGGDSGGGSSCGSSCGGGCGGD